ncbi:hypothetical protein [Marinilabilia rubra]|uniref:Uncharacterized protein n=1 Tax=Marinilabilia rubra TaxID=2162893 RepID=A0A2U2B500_9BACT|nr:hypothetical protein [Marinilabilia rubra]PWD98135.1 hypothetical protein DDZ16_17495 [Marinilabilia rubra]
MIKKLISILMILLLAVSCDEEVTLVASFEESGSVPVQADDFFEMITIPGASVQAAINDAMDEDGQIEMVVLEGLLLNVSARSENTASSLEINIDILSWDTNNYLPILDEFEVDVPDENVPVLTNLQATGVSALKSQLNQLATGSSSRDIEFTIDGTVSPSGATVRANVEIWVEGSVVYVQLTD